MHARTARGSNVMYPWKCNSRGLFAGCTLIFGVTNGQVYFAHVRPLGDTRAPSTDPATRWQNTRSDLAANLDAHGTFDGINIGNRAHFFAVGGRAMNEVGCSILWHHDTTDSVWARPLAWIPRS